MSTTKKKVLRGTIDKLGVLELETILLKLSAVDLSRCKQVCKPWRSLISSDYFVTEHLNRSRSDPSCQKLIVCDEILFDKPPGPFKSVICFSSDCMSIVGSVNGLICFAARMSGFRPGYNFPVTPDNIWISNPVTGLCRKLPSPSSYTLITPDTTTSKFAFWWDPYNGGVYKLAKIVSYKNGRTMVDLWESTSPDTWTTLNADAPFYFCFCEYFSWAHPCDVLIEGVAAYWIVVDHRGMMFVLSLDLKTLQLKAIPIPEPLMRDDDLYYFGGKLNRYLFGGNLNGEFVLLHKRSHPGSGMYHIWTMNVTQGWNKSFEIFFDFSFQICLGTMNGKLVFQTINDMLILYDLGISRTYEVFERDPQLKEIVMVFACGFVGSLVSIDGFGFEWNDRLKLAMDLGLNGMTDSN